MAKVTITISDEEMEGHLTVGLEFSPAIVHSNDSEKFQRENPQTHVAAYLAWAAIDDFMGEDPTSIETFPPTPPIVI